MGMPAGQPEITTIEALRHLPDDGRKHELVRARYVVTPAPSPRHQSALRYLVRALEVELSDRDDVALFWSPADLVLGRESLVQPDLFVAKKNERSVIREWADVGVPLLVVEVVSPRTAQYDRGMKRRLYQEAAVAEYWVVDLDSRVVERWRPHDDRPEVLTDILRWSLEVGVAGTIDLAALFAATD